MYTKLKLCPVSGTLERAGSNPSGKNRRRLDQALSGHGVSVPRQVRCGAALGSAEGLS